MQDTTGRRIFRSGRNPGRARAGADYRAPTDRRQHPPVEIIRWTDRVNLALTMAIVGMGHAQESHHAHSNSCGPPRVRDRVSGSSARSGLDSKSVPGDRHAPNPFSLNLPVRSARASFLKNVPPTFFPVRSCEPSNPGLHNREKTEISMTQHIAPPTAL